MNTRDAKEILLLYRGPIDDSDPQFQAALDYAKTDPELGQWLREQTKCYDLIRAKLRAIEPPPGLSEKIVRRWPIPFPRDWSRIGQLAAAILISASVTGLLMKLLHRLQLERSRSRQMRQGLYQTRFARRNQSSRWKGVFADWRSRPFH